MADSLNGFILLTESKLDSTSTDFAGNSSSLDARSFQEQYNLTLEKDLYPNLKLFANGLLQRTTSDTRSDGQDRDSVNILERPFVELSLRTPMYAAGINFSRVISKTENDNGASTVLYTDTYNAVLGWKPEGLPLIDVRLLKFYTYDRDHAFEDVVSDQATLESYYRPVQQLQFRYQGAYVDTKDNLRVVDTKRVSNDIRVSYDDRFLRDRVSFSSYYDVGRFSLETAAAGQAGVSMQVFAFDGLYSSSTLPEHVQLAPAPFLIDNDLATPNNNVINIGSGPATGPPPQDTADRNIGLRFGAVTELNTLEVWVTLNNPANTGTIDLFATSIASSYLWSIYTSTDGTSWSAYQTGMQAPFQIYGPIPGVGKFVLSFVGVKAQYIKVVVKPLVPIGSALEFPAVAVTELDAFIVKPAETLVGTRTGSSRTASVYVKTQLLDKPFVFYDFSYLGYAMDNVVNVTRKSTITNGLSVNQRFSPVLTGTAQAQRVDDSDPTGETVTYQYTATVMAVPLPTLTDNLSISYVDRDAPTGRTKTASVFVANAADLYRNIGGFVNAGVSAGTSELDQRTESSLYSAGLTLQPRKTLTITLSYSDMESEISGGGQPETTVSTEREDAAIAYNPFSNLYLFGSLGHLNQAGERNTLKSYGVSWAPFPGGALQFNFSYNEIAQTRDKTIDTIFSSLVRWYLTRGTYLEATWSSIANSSTFIESTTRIFSTSLRMPL